MTVSSSFEPLDVGEAALDGLYEIRPSDGRMRSTRTGDELRCNSRGEAFVCDRSGRRAWRSVAALLVAHRALREAAPRGPLAPCRTVAWVSVAAAVFLVAAAATAFSVVPCQHGSVVERLLDTISPVAERVREAFWQAIDHIERAKEEFLRGGEERERDTGLD